MKKIILAVMCIFLTGCSTGTDVNEMAYVRAVAVDSGNVTFAFYLDEQILSVSADSMDKAKSAVELSLGKKIFTGHTELVILGECDEREVLDYLLSQWKVPPACKAAKSENGGEILNSRKAEDIVGILEMAEEKNATGKCDIVTVLGQILNGKNEDLPLLTEEGQLQNKQ